MLTDLVLRPELHGALGPWDEIINMIPLVVGAVLLAYLYFTSRRRPPSDDDQPPDAEGLAETVHDSQPGP